ncbi:MULTISPECIES: SSI family serine proteinase inhibitor [Nocardiopsis]|uniref:Proteinase inhibitor I16 subtilisin-type inhibitor n=1 Tax=Nocardiopsis sinuspersici TaxID=501010 RepID=A0A1V3C788_9ACTN|nr:MULTISPECIES: SSI family serine proteinase inhibitor [Nocardiopsis]OOC56615.1 proteinase inhibitor I16 subtilisin-type inhibitor [Nocardiopsis sinuspersici]
MKRTIPALAAAPVLALVLAAPVHAAEAAQTSPAIYVLSVRDVSSGATKAISLQCHPAGGTHPKAEEACEAIAEGGSIEGVEGPGGDCTMIHDPVVATASGAEEYQREFSNRCLLTAGKGAVFDF